MWKWILRIFLVVNLGMYVKYVIENMFFDFGINLNVFLWVKW